MPLVTQNVFIDTEFFVTANLDFQSNTIKSFEKLCSDNELNHITTTIVIQEVKRKINDKINEALKDIKKFKHKAAMLREYDDETISLFFKEIDEQDLKIKALTSFDNFINTSNTEILDMSSVDGNEIIDMFFTQKAPFSDKKPNEFRDAFSLLALKSQLEGQEKIYIISSDPDLKNFCNENEHFINIETLSKFLDIYNKHKDERSDFIEQFMQSKKDYIKEVITTLLEEADAYNSSSWEDAELDSFEVLEISEFDPEIIHIDDTNCQIRFDIDVKFLINVVGPDFQNGIYNKEEGRMYSFDSIERQEEETHTFSIELDLYFKADVDEFIEEDFELHIANISGGIEFSVEEETPFAYY